jgi:hypothetical protein
VNCVATLLYVNREPLAVEAVLRTLLEKAYHGAACRVASVQRSPGCAKVEATAELSAEPVMALEFRWSAAVLTVSAAGVRDGIEVDLYDPFAPLMISGAVSELVWDSE